MENQPDDDRSESAEDSAYNNFMLFLIDNTSAKLPEKAGWLLKRTGNPFKHWQRRYFVLKNKKLRYFHSETDTKPAGSFNFDLISVNVQLIRSETATELILQPVFSDRKFQLRSEQPGELEEWATCLSEHISESAGRLTNITSVSRASKFWRWDRISNSQFKATASTGDILLFSGKNLAAKAQRFVTRSKYDHVALILKYSSNQLAILEATSLDVWLCRVSRC
jgi:hypothetical protein